jgi:predicted nucleic acid-binding protein
VIAYVDSSVLTRVYLPDEPGHDDARSLLSDPEVARVTGSWTWIETTGALVRAGRAGRGEIPDLLQSLDDDVRGGGSVTVLAVPQPEVEEVAMELAREHGVRAMDAWHLAAASVMLPQLAAPEEPVAFASRDKVQAEVAASLGFEVI